MGTRIVGRRDNGEGKSVDIVSSSLAIHSTVCRQKSDVSSDYPESRISIKSVGMANCK